MGCSRAVLGRSLAHMGGARARVGCAGRSWAAHVEATEGGRARRGVGVGGEGARGAAGGGRRLVRGTETRALGAVDQAVLCAVRRGTSSPGRRQGGPLCGAPRYELFGP